MNSLDYVISHAVRTLPDSIVERRDLLNHLIALLPKRHPARIKLTQMLAGLMQQNLLQLELPNLLSVVATKKN